MQRATRWSATLPDRRWVAACALALAALSGPGASAPARAQGAPAAPAQSVVVAGRDDAEIRIELPAHPADADLVALPPGPRADLRFMVDARSIRVQPGGELLYTFVVIAPSGSRSVSHEQMRCESREWRLLAVAGTPPGNASPRWTPARQPRWRLLPDGDAFGQRAVLHKDIFCPGRVAVADAREAVAALRAGMHPRANP